MRCAAVMGVSQCRYDGRCSDVGSYGYEDGRELLPRDQLLYWCSHTFARMRWRGMAVRMVVSKGGGVVSDARGDGGSCSAGTRDMCARMVLNGWSGCRGGDVTCCANSAAVVLPLATPSRSHR